MALVQIPTPVTAAGGMTLLSTTTLSGTSTVVSGIPGTYKHLFVLIDDQGTSSIAQISFKVNNGTSPSASYSSASGTMVTSSTAWELSQQRITSANQAANVWGIWVYNYASTTSHKTGNWVGSVNDNSTGAATFWGFGRYTNDTAVTSVALTTDVANSLNAGTINIYGVN